MSVWRPYASVSIGAIGRGCYTTLGELISHRHGREGAARGGFVEKTEQKQGSFSFVRRRVRRTPRTKLSLFMFSRSLGPTLPVPKRSVAYG